MTTTNLAMTLPTVGASDDTWGTTLNADLDLIDAFAGKVPVKLLSGTVTSLGDLDLALSSSYTAYQLILTNVTSGTSQIFVRFDVGGVQTTPYNYARKDVAPGLDTVVSGSSGAAIFLTPTVLSQGTDTDTGARFTIDINNRLNVTTSRINMDWRGNYYNSGYGMGFSEGGGSLNSQTARATAIKVGGFAAASYTAGIRCSYALYGIPGLA